MKWAPTRWCECINACRCMSSLARHICMWQPTCYSSNIICFGIVLCRTSLPMCVPSRISCRSFVFYTICCCCCFYCCCFYCFHSWHEESSMCALILSLHIAHMQKSHAFRNLMSTTRKGKHTIISSSRNKNDGVNCTNSCVFSVQRVNRY